ncbi:MAG: Crp/Fnr family transcriptional regulator [Oscillospiraceae bacterium]|nr:Crp/Fnr family transcriptional regulator [Oscillospiraceae bacterium]
MEQYLPVLTRAPLFAGMTEEEIRSALNCLGAVASEYPAGSYILRAGEHTEHMGVLLSGSGLIIQEDVWGRRNIMSRVAVGDSFGESFAASPGAVLNISVVAHEDSRILRLNVGKILSVCPAACGHHSRMVRNLASALAQKALQFNEKITHMSRRTTREKLLSYLSAQSLRQGSAEFDIPYDRQQLADFLCVERAAMSAELSKLKKEGLIDFRRSHFVILSPIAGEDRA